MSTFESKKKIIWRISKNTAMIITLWSLMESQKEMKLSNGTLVIQDLPLEYYKEKSGNMM